MPQDQAKEKTILVMLNDLNTCELLSQAISQQSSYKVLFVKDEHWAFEVLKVVKPSLFVLIDQLAKANGLKLYDRLRAKIELELVPSIIVSANLPQKELAKRKIVGVREPFDLDDLVEQMKQLVGH